MITRRFIERVHDAFDELGYRETTLLNYDKFCVSAIWTLTHSRDLCDAIEAVRMYQFCLKKWRRIEKIFSRKLEVFNEYEFEGNSLISVISDEQAIGTYYITNGINSKVKEVFFTSCSFDCQMFSFSFERGKFTVFEDEDYYIRYSKRDSSIMKLFDRKKACSCNLVLSDNLGIFLENNRTQYELFSFEDFIAIYDRKYIDSIDENDILDENRLIATIEWDILEKSLNLGVAKLSIFADEQDLEMLLLFAASTFLTFQRYAQSRRTLCYATMASITSTMSRLR